MTNQKSNQIKNAYCFVCCQPATGLLELQKPHHTRRVYPYCADRAHRWIVRLESKMAQVTDQLGIE